MRGNPGAEAQRILLNTGHPTNPSKLSGRTSADATPPPSQKLKPRERRQRDWFDSLPEDLKKELQRIPTL